MKKLTLSALLALGVFSFLKDSSIFALSEAKAGYCASQGCSTSGGYCGEYHCVVLSIGDWCLVGRNCTGKKGEQVKA
jgi:hypothetical protein